MKQFLPFPLRQFRHDKVVGVVDELEDNVIGHVLIEIDIVPQALVHVPCRADAIVSGTQFLGILWRGPQAAAVKNLDIHIAEPLGAS